MDDEAGAHQYTSTAVAMRELLHAVLSHLECVRGCVSDVWLGGLGCCGRRRVAYRRRLKTAFAPKIDSLRMGVFGSSEVIVIVPRLMHCM